MTAILVIGTVSDGALTSSTLEAVGVARALGGARIFGTLIGKGLASAGEALAQAGLDQVFVFDDERLSPYRADSYVAAGAAVVSRCKPDLILAPQNTDVSEWAPLLAGQLGASLATNCTRLAFDGDELIATRPVCGGAVQAEYGFNHSPYFATLAVGAFSATGPSSSASDVVAKVEAIALPDTSSRVTVVEELPETVGSGPSLRKAKVVVSGGLGVGSKENWRLVEEAAISLGAAVGATRAVVEMGWVPQSIQVGFSGLKISPDLYIAVGISGAVHHLAGLGGAKAIVAINKDPEAGIFRAARFGVVGDVREVVPAFVARVKELREGQA